MGVKIDVKMKPTDKILGRIFDDSAGRFLAETWGKIFTKYISHRGLVSRLHLKALETQS